MSATYHTKGAKVKSRYNTEDDLSVYADTTTTPTTTKGGLSETRQAQYDSLYENYLTDKSALEEQKSLAEQEASINHELLMKYLPVLNRQNGLYGLGVAQSANVEALANYQNNLNTINRNYAASMAELDKGWNDSRLSLYGQQATEDREDSLAAYNEAYDLIVAGAETKTKDEIDNYIAALDVDEATKERLGSLANYLYGDVEETAKNTFTTDAKVDNEGVVTVGVGSRSIPLYLGGMVSIPTNEANKYGEGEVFLYDNAILVKKNGNVYQVVDENREATSQKYSKVYDYLKNGVIPEGYGMAQSPDTPQSERYDRFDRPEGYKENKSPTLNFNTSNSNHTDHLNLEEFMKANDKSKSDTVKTKEDVDKIVESELPKLMVGAKNTNKK